MAKTRNDIVIVDGDKYAAVRLFNGRYQSIDRQDKALGWYDVSEETAQLILDAIKRDRERKQITLV